MHFMVTQGMRSKDVARRTIDGRRNDGRRVNPPRSRSISTFAARNRIRTGRPARCSCTSSAWRSRGNRRGADVPADAVAVEGLAGGCHRPAGTPLLVVGHAERQRRRRSTGASTRPNGVSVAVRRSSSRSPTRGSRPRNGWSCVSCSMAPNLYRSVICRDQEPQNILVSQSRRDADLGDTDSFRILLDTFNDVERLRLRHEPVRDRHDGQVMAEGQTGQTGGGGAGASFNVNWDAELDRSRADHRTRVGSRVCDSAADAARSTPGRSGRGASARGTSGARTNRSLSPVPRGYTLCRVSVAGKLQGLSLPARRDVRFLPYVAAPRSPTTRRSRPAVNRRETSAWIPVGCARRSHAGSHGQCRLRAGRSRRTWISLTRFPLFFAEKRPFFLENAQLFQLGQP